MIQKFVSKLSDKEKKWFYICLIFVVVALFDRLFLGPVWDKIQAIDGEIAQQEVSIKRDIRFLQYKDKILQESKVFDKYFTKDMKEEDVINTEFFSKVERIANESNINLIKSNPAETKKEKMFTEYYANLDCTGDLKDVIAFMHKINSTDDLFKIVKFNMTPKRGTPSDVNVSMTIVKLIIGPSAVSPSAP